MTASDGQQGAGVTIENALGVIDGSHMLMENLSRKKDPYKPQDIECCADRWVMS
jgi:hypothetical protein